ncbi:MAG: peptidylprolyl isomerase, partial [Patescibacteria group bacterium]
DFSELGMRVDFSTDEGKRRLEIKEKDLLDKMIEDAIIYELAKERGIKITPSLIKQSIERKIGEYSSGDYLRENMDKLYGWDLDDFEKRIVQPDLYKENLQNYVEEKERDWEKKRELISEAKLELDKGKSFEEVVKAYSEGESVNSAGDLGWFSKKQILPEISEAVFSLDKGETSGILESSLGFHLINLVDRKTEKETEFVKIRQIFIRKQDFGDWLSEEKKKRSVWIPIRGLYWNREEGRVDFESQEMRDYEKKLLEESTGDASLIF